MPELDVFTQSELQWGALKTGILGMFYPHPERPNAIEFSGDINNFVSAHKYRIYAPDDSLLDLIVNSIVPQEDRFDVGKLRLTECRLPLPGKSLPDVDIDISVKDLMGTRTAMFGKTRLGKSNVVKLIAQSLLETTDSDKCIYEVTDVTMQTLEQLKMERTVLDTLEPIKGKRYERLPEFKEAVANALSGTVSNDKLKEIGPEIVRHSITRVGQLIFDINGEYANDNPQDSSLSLKSAYPDRCEVYALSPKESTPSKPLKLNFYEQPSSALPILSSLLKQDGRLSGYINAFASVELPTIDEIQKLPVDNDKIRAIRKVQMFWAILRKANFAADEARLRGLGLNSGSTHAMNPGFSSKLRDEAYRSEGTTPAPPQPSNLDELRKELELVNRFRRANPGNSALTTGSGKDLFDADDIALLQFLEPEPGRSGVTLLQPYRSYHDAKAGDFVEEILNSLDDGQTVILDLGNANPQVMAYFSDELSRSVFRHQVDKFSNNKLGNHYIQIYFEEAHNLFPRKEDPTTIYSRFAKERAKYNIGMVYSTQSPTTVNQDLLAQTENFFIAHLASLDDVNALAKVNRAYESLKEDILIAKTPGYIRMLTRSHRFVVSMQAKRFMPLHS